ncbi:MAG: hypothetical protein KA004_03620 [Verrucomicrobiales bacterium]|nr:hypothetical protein [Verrucomicrobiales bacterium]
MKCSLLLAAATCAFLLSGCEMFRMKGPFKVHDPVAVVPDDFLFTKYEPMNRWLDTAVRVQIFDVPLSHVFHANELRGLNIQIVKPLPKDSLVTMDRIAITRRQFLWTLCHEHQLMMTPVFGTRGEQSYIAVRPRPPIR